MKPTRHEVERSFYLAQYQELYRRYLRHQAYRYDVERAWALYYRTVGESAKETRVTLDELCRVEVLG